jgi:hypothetical protein
MLRRLLAVAAVTAAVAAACGQTPPERSPLPDLPDEIVFPPAPSTTADPVPDDGTCYLVVAVGARVRSVPPDSGVGGVMRPGDVITGVAGAPVTSLETLLAAMADVAPGDEVPVGWLRDGTPMETTVQAGSRPEDPGEAMLGVLAEGEIRAVTPDEVGDDAPAGGVHVAFAADRMYLVDPLAGSWYATGVDRPERGLVVVGTDLYAQRGPGDPTLSPLTPGADPIVVPTGDRTLLRAFLDVADLLVVALATLDPSDPDVALELLLAGVDPAAGELVWAWAPVDAAGGALPVFAFRSPDGRQLIVTLEQDGVRHHTLLDGAGIPLAGFATDVDLAPPGSTFGGWYDDDTVAFVVNTGGEFVVQLVDLADSSMRAAASFPSGEDLRQVWSVGNGRHLMTLGETEARLYDVETQSPGRLLARACDVGIVAGPAS